MFGSRKEKKNVKENGLFMFGFMIKYTKENQI